MNDRTLKKIRMVTFYLLGLLGSLGGSKITKRCYQEVLL